MCGICGFITNRSVLSIEESIEKMTDSLYHRGPDFQNHEVISTSNGKVALGHARLSILDLSSLGNQPMDFLHMSMIFNGEVYNYREIRSDLKNLGYDFISDSDSEVVLKGFHRWGVKVLDRMIGMFAFVIFDKQNETLFLARDRVGVKPLFYTHKDDSFVFGSELRVFRSNDVMDLKLNQDSIFQYLHYGYFPEPNTVYQDVFKVKPGYYGFYDLNKNELSFEQYWNPATFHNARKLTISEEDIISDLDSLFKSSFNYRMISDVPVGVFLSGGYDSALVAAILQDTNTTNIKTFTIGFHENQYNEAEDAKKIAAFLGTDHYEYYCTAEDGMSIIPELGSLYDEPFGDSSAVPTTILSRFCKENVTVALSADGGDEIFAGYNNYSSFASTTARLNSLKSISPGLVNTISRIAQSLSITNFLAPKKAHLYDMALKYLTDNDLLAFNKSYRLQNKSSFIQSMFLDKSQMPSSSFLSLVELDAISDPIESSQFMDLLTYLPGDILTKVDRATMSASLEGREPLLDHRIIEYAAKIPTSLHFKSGVKKYLLKQVTHKYIPKELMDRPKKGFGIPVKHWMRNELKELTLDYLNRESIDKDRIFNSKNVINLRDEYLKGDLKNFELVWYLLAFYIWKEKN